MISENVTNRYLRQADLAPPLGFPGGPCHVVQRINDEVRTPRLKSDLMTDVERGEDLSNAEAAKVYRTEIEKGKGPFRKILIGPHTQYRMDLRSVTVPEVRLAIQSFFKQLNDEKSRGGGKVWLEDLQRGNPIEWIDPRIGLKVVFRREGRDGVKLITTFWKGHPDPKAPGLAQCPVSKMSTARRVTERFLKRAFSFTLPEAYEFMGLDMSASEREVKTRYHELAREYHPDAQGDVVLMQKLNAAKEVIDSGGAGGGSSYRTPTPRQPERPKVKTLSKSDLETFAQQIIDNMLWQVLLREGMKWLPVDVSIMDIYRPIGRKLRTFRLTKYSKPNDPDVSHVMNILNSAGDIFDAQINPRKTEGWITFINSKGHYQSISFEKVKVRKKKQPGVGMKPSQVDEYLRQKGFVQLGGGSKQTYWGVRGQKKGEGTFLRTKSKTIRVVRRDRAYGRKLVDWGVFNEVYYGKVTPKYLDQVYEYLKKKEREN